MGDNKYYIPGLDEFNTSLEFEVHNSKDYFFFEAPEGWYPTKMDYGVLGNIENLHKLILDKQIRVKYLNREDILSEGFVEGLKDPHRIFAEKEIHFRGSEAKLCVIYNLVSKWCLINIDWNDGLVCYAGIIKNKTEFNKILKSTALCEVNKRA